MKKEVFSFVFVGMFVLLSISFVFGVTITETQITSSSRGEQYAKINGNKIVWLEYNDLNTDIKVYDISTGQTVLVISSLTYKGFPEVYGNKIVWDEDINDDYNNNIYVYDVLTRQKTQITNEAVSQGFPKIYGNRIIWEDARNGNKDIYMCDLSLNGNTGGCLVGDVKTQVTSGSRFQSSLDIHENKIVWLDVAGGFPVLSDIYMCDLSLNGNTGGCLVGDVKTQITRDPTGQSKPLIYGNTVVGMDYKNGKWDIYIYNISTGQEFQITDDSISLYSTAPAIYGNKIVWEEGRNTANSDIYMCDLSLNGNTGGCLIGDLKTQITSDPTGQYTPEIYGNKIVWMDRRNGNYDIYMATLSEGCTPNCVDKECGSDGCGGSCGSCTGGEICNTGTGQCVCVPACSGKECGSDGCSGSCGTCTGGETCNTGTGQCVASCTPSCIGKECGADGCGGSCGSCTGGETCDTGTLQCITGCTPNCVDKECGDDGCGAVCGSCGTQSSCSSGSCSCGVGFADCNSQQSDGCEVNINTNLSNCGSCGNACTMGQICSSGVCEIAASCTIDHDCDDGLVCNGFEICSGGSCASGIAVNCNDGIDCTDEVCDEISGSCVRTDNCGNGENCDLSLMICVAGVGCVVDADCNDGVYCTDDSCEEMLGLCMYSDNCPSGEICSIAFDSCEAIFGSLGNTQGGDDGVDLGFPDFPEDDGGGTSGGDSENVEIRSKTVLIRESKGAMIAVFAIIGTLIIIGLGILTYFIMKNDRGSGVGVVNSVPPGSGFGVQGGVVGGGPGTGGVGGVVAGVGGSGGVVNLGVPGGQNVGLTGQPGNKRAM